MDKSLFDYNERPKQFGKKDFWKQVRRTINGEPVNEDQIDLHTVLIGSGPAFFYELLNEFERRMDTLVQDKDTKRLVSIVFLSSLITSIKNGENLDDLIESVASKGGTTEAGLKFLYKEKFSEIFSGAVDAGIRRAKELSMD